MYMGRFADFRKRKNKRKNKQRGFAREIRAQIAARKKARSLPRAVVAAAAANRGVAPPTVPVPTSAGVTSSGPLPNYAQQYEDRHVFPVDAAYDDPYADAQIAAQMLMPQSVDPTNLSPVVMSDDAPKPKPKLDAEKIVKYGGLAFLAAKLLL